MCELCDNDRVTIVEPRDCDGGPAQQHDESCCCPACERKWQGGPEGEQHGDERGVDLAALAGGRGKGLPSADTLIAEADAMAADCHDHALAAMTWGGRWKWWTARQSALETAWHLSYIGGSPREQTTYTSLDRETPWGVSLRECWQRWLREARGETVPL